MEKTIKWGLVAPLAIIIAAVATSWATPTSVNLGSAADYAVVGVGGSVAVQSDFSLYQSATVVKGNVAEGPHTALTHGIDATVIGRWDYDLTDADPSAAGYTGTVTGGFHQIDLSGVSLDAINASNAAAALTPTQTFSTLSEHQSINLSGNEVVRITGAVTLKTDLTINGDAGSTIVFQLVSTGGQTLNLSGMTMILTGGILADNIVWNLNGTNNNQKNDLNISSGSVVYGNFLAPYRNIEVDHGDVTGRLIGGGGGVDHPGLDIHSSSRINAPQASVTTPEPSTLLLLVCGLAGLGLRKRNVGR